MKSATVTESVPYALKQPSPAQWLYTLWQIEQSNVWWSIAKKLKGIDGNSILGPKPSDIDAEDGPDDETEDLEEATDTSPDITLPAADVNILKVYINDDLCKARSIVAFRARELKRDKKINDTWVSRGMIIIKDKFNKIIAWVPSHNWNNSNEFMIYHLDLMYWYRLLWPLYTCVLAYSPGFIICFVKT